LQKATNLARSVLDDYKPISMEKKGGSSMLSIKTFLERYTKSDFGQIGHNELVLGFTEALQFLVQPPSSPSPSIITQFDQILKESEEEVRYLLWGKHMTGSRQKEESIEEIRTFIRDVWTSVEAILPSTS